MSALGFLGSSGRFRDCVTCGIRRDYVLGTVFPEIGIVCITCPLDYPMLADSQRYIQFQYYPGSQND